jgi:hypothetical protein
MNSLRPGNIPVATRDSDKIKSSVNVYKSFSINDLISFSSRLSPDNSPSISSTWKWFDRHHVFVINKLSALKLTDDRDN